MNIVINNYIYIIYFIIRIYNMNNTNNRINDMINISIRDIELTQIRKKIEDNNIIKDICENNEIPFCEKRIEQFFNISFLSCIRRKNKLVKIFIPIITNLILISSLFSPLFYPNYYINQTEIWVTDMCIITIVYNYILYLQYNWNKVSSYENINISKKVHYFSILFSFLFILYYLYYAILMFSYHSENVVIIQLKNILMSSAWYLFFSTCAVIYYFICVKLQQRSTSIELWMKEIRNNAEVITKEIFYTNYNYHYMMVQRFSANWNFIIFLVFILLTFHIPIDAVSILFEKNYYDIPGLCIKLLSLAWYIYCICKLNDYENKIIPFLYKLRLFDINDMEFITKYIEYRPIGLPFYGIKINTGFFIKILLLLLNLIIPSIYALVSNNIMILKK